MYHSIHTDFILTPIQEVLVEGINACRAIGDGLETQPLSEYIQSSLFLKITGALEQKLKCICWEIATHDYSFRYDFIQGRHQLGECSDYKSKNKIYNLLLNQIYKINGQYQTVSDNSVKGTLIDGVIEDIKRIFEDTNVSTWEQNPFAFYKDNIRSRFIKEQILIERSGGKSGQKLFESMLQNDYEKIVYEHRNRLAHNTTSYQRRLPQLNTIAADEYRWHNYFYRYSLLLLIDAIFIKLYKDYKVYLESSF